MQINAMLALLASVIFTISQATGTQSSWGTATITLLTPGAQKSFQVPLDGSRIYPDFSDSTSWISTSSQLIILNRHCTFLTSSGINSLSQLGGNYFALGPPQVVQGIRCWNPNLIKDHPTPSWNAKRDELSEEDDDGDVAVVVEQQRTGSTGGPNNRYVTIQFVGAADANYTISTSLAGYTSLVPEWQPFNIAVSQLVSYDTDVVKYCRLETQNPVGPLQDLGPDRWQISPPTVIKTLTCYCDPRIKRCI